MTSWGKRLLIAAVTMVFCLFFINLSSLGPGPVVEQDSTANLLTMQQQLHRLGYLETAPTGYYDRETGAAVKKMQQEHNLQSNGFVNKQTIDLINRLMDQLARQKEVLGFYVGDEPGIPSSYATLAARKDIITSVSPFWYRLDAENPVRLETGASPQEISELMDYSRDNGVRSFALIHNILYGKSSVGRDLLHNVLENPNKRQALVANIFNLVKDTGFDGVCMDIENIYPGDRDLYIELLSALSARLKPAGYSLIVSVPAKQSGARNGGWGDSFNYQSVGRYADLVVIMAYDENSAIGESGPIASRNWVERTVEYALTQLPPEKILLGVPGYGFDWNLDLKSSRYLSYEMAMQTASAYRQNVRWDAQSRVPYFNYRDEDGFRHDVYFENADSMSPKLDLVQKYNLKGIAIWRLGMEDPASWPVIDDKINQHPGAQPALRRTPGD